ncbi:PREDICTED: uncharacterized protein LOC104595001 [Nelumbo nucifera]|uniref:Uncharacterized protein LOC104595001 n=1 Tax=Nelumbo nucifera TaxID=4432 RepID=A0A1U8Q4C3_NELNU|nr:PREDICTED: uncharacterized protein LOC104595001 [Nelumbo nucifera]
MQALIRAQATVRAQKTRALLNKEHRYPPRKSIEIFDKTRSEHTASIHSRRLSASIETAINTFEESPKIVEIDTGRPKSRSRRINTSMSECGEDPPYQTISSPLPCQSPVRVCDVARPASHGSERSHALAVHTIRRRVARPPNARTVP